VKTANILLLFSFGMPAFPVDTHILRVTKRLGLVPGTSTLAKAALSLEPHVGTGDHGPLHLNLIRLGREVCRPRDPRCPECPLLPVCPEGKRNTKAHPAPVRNTLPRVPRSVRLEGHATGESGGAAAGGGRPTLGLNTLPGVPPPKEERGAK
jgi:adenine-specific DNA glycosylase